jgi:formylglycine-generating enzyme required for sulfatase activity
MCDVLHYLHTAFAPPIIHRDIKPLNLKLMPNGQVVLLDFGLAKGARPGMSVVKSLLAGTPHYAPLEQLNRKANQEQQTDPRSDIYSLAVTLHQLLTGELPPDAVDRVQAAALGEPDPLRPAHELAPAIAEPFSLALQRAAAVFAKDRPASVAELRWMLRQPVVPEPPTVFVMPPPIVTPPPVMQPKPAPPPIVRPQPAAPQSYSEDLGNGIRLEMIAIPGGSFPMGSPEGVGFDDERPQHRVTLAPFWLGKYVVTQAQWQAVMGSNPSRFKGADLPVEMVLWNDAVKFCEMVSQRTGKSYRLPSEAELEYACRAGSNGQYCFGDDEALLDEYAWYGNNSGRQRINADKLWEEVGGDGSKYWGRLEKNGNQTHPVGRKKPNAWGLYDMHGNVWEWCSDWYSDSYYVECQKQGTVAGPAGPSAGSDRVIRGGSWDGHAVSCRSAARFRSAPVIRDDALGFRLVRIGR